MQGSMNITCAAFFYNTDTNIFLRTLLSTMTRSKRKVRKSSKRAARKSSKRSKRASGPKRKTFRAATPEQGTSSQEARTAPDTDMQHEADIARELKSTLAAEAQGIKLRLTVMSLPNNRFHFNFHNLTTFFDIGNNQQLTLKMVMRLFVLLSGSNGIGTTKDETVLLNGVETANITIEVPQATITLNGETIASLGDKINPHLIQALRVYDDEVLEIDAVIQDDDSLVIWFKKPGAVSPDVSHHVRQRTAMSPMPRRGPLFGADDAPDALDDAVGALAQLAID